MSIYFPKPGKESILKDSMHRFGKTMEGKEGLIMTQTSKNEDRNRLLGLAIWKSKESWLAARSTMMEAVKDDNFDDWESKPPEVYHLSEV